MIAAVHPEVILGNFDIPSSNYSLVENTNGLINKSFVVINADDEPVYFLQQIDHTVFKDIPGLMQNITTVCNFLTERDDSFPHLSLINNINSATYYKTKEGAYWRLYQYVDGETLFRADNPGIAAAAGSSFGEFLDKLSNMDPSLLIETIPRFHDIELRANQFREACDLANAERKKKSGKLIELVEEHIHKMLSYYRLIKQKSALTITHNDTKLSNLLFSKNGHGHIVVDYDTLMPGYLPLDFGDSVRTICSTTVEDDLNLDETKYDLELFEAFSTSFVKRIFEKGKEEETELLPMAACYMPFLMGLRMLTDYLKNDVYYNINYPDHNLDRAANQFTLYMSGLSLQPEMNTIVKTTR